MKRTVHWDHGGPRVTVAGVIFRPDCPPSWSAARIGDRVDVDRDGLVTLPTGKREAWLPDPEPGA